MDKQAFWAIVNKATGKISRGPNEFKIYSSRTEARSFNGLFHKKQQGNYRISKVEIFEDIKMFSLNTEMRWLASTY